MEFDKVIRDRKATRMFSSKRLEKEKIDKILEAGRLAPSAKNNQPVKIYVAYSLEGLSKIDKATKCRYGAPCVLIICGDKDKAYKKGEYSSYEMDASILCTHMMLEATNLGVDNIWVLLFDEKVLREEFDIPNNLVPVCLLPIGYKSMVCPPSPFHKIRKSINDLVEYK